MNSIHVDPNYSLINDGAPHSGGGFKMQILCKVRHITAQFSVTERSNVNVMQGPRNRCVERTLKKIDL